MANPAAIAAIGFFSPFIGSLFGFLIALLVKRMGRRLEGALSGFTAGLLIAFVCFRLLKEGFAAAPLYVGVTGILAGVAASAYIEGLAAGKNGRGAPLIVAGAVMLHHLPEGIALGAMCAVSLPQGLLLAVIIMLHCIPEAAAVFITLKGRIKRTSGPLLAAALSAPMAAGGVLGAFLTEISGLFLCLSLTFAGGVMLYITCGEMLPDSKRLWNGRLTTVCSLLGFVLGVVITA